MSIFFYKDKPAFDSKKFTATMRVLIALIITPPLYSVVGALAPSVADHISPMIADAVIGAVAAVYLAGQAWVDKTLASKNITTTAP